MADSVGMIGTGNFGLAITDLLASNSNVILYARRKEIIEEFQNSKTIKEHKIPESVSVTGDLNELVDKCKLIYFMVPSKFFRKTLVSCASHLKPEHILIHGTKGFDVEMQGDEPGEIHRMSEVILQETSVVRVGSLSGPNLAKEILAGKPAAAVVASRFDEVIALGESSLKSPRFRVYGSHDISGVELAGALKNVVAIASGILSGLDLGENARAFLITRGLAEMTRLGKALGAEPDGFMGLAGVGDLLATCTSAKSRNFTVGMKLAKGQKLSDILSQTSEVAEGVPTVNISKTLSQRVSVYTPLIDGLYDILFEDKPIPEVIASLMERPFQKDVDFL
jgi:glycerol-3-phosphate dehydrogenase (NAD(P)+)